MFKPINKYSNRFYCTQEAPICAIPIPWSWNLREKGEDDIQWSLRGAIKNATQSRSIHEGSVSEWRSMCWLLSLMHQAVVASVTTLTSEVNWVDRFECRLWDISLNKIGCRCDISQVILILSFIEALDYCRIFHPTFFTINLYVTVVCDLYHLVKFINCCSWDLVEHIIL
jgi:hypothetical protein